MQEIFIHEVGLRDGLQNERQTVPMEIKIRWIDALMESGVDIIQVGSFVHKEKVPQMADTDALFEHYRQNGEKNPKVILSGLVLNERGMERGMACGVEMFCMGVSASETHSQKNTGMSPVKAMGQILSMAKKASGAGKKVQASVQSAFGCGFDGPIEEERVLAMVQQYLDAGIRNISLADTAGHANPQQVERLFSAIRKMDPNVELACHFHNTYGLGMANCYAALKIGVRYVETAVGGLGGCPFTKVAAGNVCTEDFVHSIQRAGVRTDIDIFKLLAVSKDFSLFFNRELPGAILKSGSLIKPRPKKMMQNIRVLDMTNVLSGPFATVHLALLGAEVVKIENPDGGDLARKLGAVPELNQKLMGTSFLAQNANKKSITLNLKVEEAKEIFRKLLKISDVVVENFRPGVMDRLGFSYAEVRKINPKIIYCAISGFGQTGPDAFKPAYDQIIQGLSGVMAVNGDERLNPLRAGFPVCDTVGGLNAAFAIMAALYYREKTGEGQFIDVALLDSIMPLMGWVAANLLIGGQQPVLLGNDNFTAAPSGTFVTKDGYVNIAANQQKQWEDLATALGLPELITDPRFQERDTRKKNRKLLTPLLEAKLKQQNTDYWVEVLNAKGIPTGDIYSLEKALNADQVKYRNTIENVKDRNLGDLKLFNLTAKFSATPGSIDTPPPTLGQHQEEILGQLGYTKDDLKILKEKQAI
jgi:crotonobetainyl-CoA:carnitine CoA-transferase CaiB-like acyl-CoA transferase/isopropylmalate/homocitrate/citramalate synthase